MTKFEAYKILQARVDLDEPEIIDPETDDYSAWLKEQTEALKIAINALREKIPFLGHEAGINFNKQYLDQINLDLWVRQGKDVEEIMKSMRNYNVNHTVLPDELCGDLFFYMSVAEFADYLREKGYVIKEETHYIVKEVNKS